MKLDHRLLILYLMPCLPCTATQRETIAGERMQHQEDSLSQAEARIISLQVSMRLYDMG